MIFIPGLPVNDGLSRPVRVSYPPEGSLLNPRFPAPVNMYVRPSQVTTSVIMRVLAQAVPGRVPAPGSAAGGSLSSAGRHPRSGRWYSQYEILNGGTGARPDGDGVSAMDELVVNVMNTPVEAIETEFPVRVERYELAGNSGGPGLFAAASACAGSGASWPTKPASICAWTGSSSPPSACSAPSPRALPGRC